MEGKKKPVNSNRSAQLMNIIINSLYSHREIFLRELVSNASDAIDKLRFKAQTDADILGTDTEFKIKIIPDKENRTLEISDNGIGKSYDEVVENIGTIAQSGTANFLEAAAAAGKPEMLTPELIGQSVWDSTAPSSLRQGHLHESRRVGSGRQVGILRDVLHHRRSEKKAAHVGHPPPEKAKKTQQDFTRSGPSPGHKKHSDLSPTVCMDVERTEPSWMRTATGGDKRKRSSRKRPQLHEAIWPAIEGDLDEEYDEFYQHISHDWTPPLARLHVKLEGATEYSALLYIPSRPPFDFFYGSTNPASSFTAAGLHHGKCKELMPRTSSSRVGMPRT